jgi:hypothetical protein
MTKGFWDILSDNLDTIGTFVSMVNPVAGAVVKITDAIVNSENETISNDSVSKVLHSMSQSNGNGVDKELLNIVDNYLANKQGR